VKWAKICKAKKKGVVDKEFEKIEYRFVMQAVVDP
jgi:hypothetical protein